MSVKIQADENDPNRILASPTKEFFIHMLTKDITLIDAISDLVDNCIDGAKRTRENENYTDLVININISHNSFQISDNCGGIPVDIARKYAFRFGRPEGMSRVDHSIGNFGVGMKRALFKIGSFFSIESKTRESFFVVEQDIGRWAEDPDKWDFRFKEVSEDLSNPVDECGTKIQVSELYSGISDEFSLENFSTRLRYKLQSFHQKSMEQGLSITLNSLPLAFEPAALLSSLELRPAFEQLEKEDGKVKVKIYTGISEREPKKAGWTVFCNGRLILEADKSFVTGWGRESGMPEYHNDYARFRGYVFFDADQSDLLPWNTTKSSVDSDSPLYRSIKLEMIKMMHPVVDFLREVSKERSEQGNTDPTSLDLAINEAKPAKLSQLELAIEKNQLSTESQLSQKVTFAAPTRKSLSPTEGRVQYSKPLSEIEKVKKSLNVTTLTAVGQGTFEYYLRMECES